MPKAPVYFTAMFGLFDIQILIAGMLAGISSATLGTYLVLRKASMLADAISHAVLPGIVIGFFVAGTRSIPAMLIGAGITAFLCTAGIEFLRQRVRLRSDLSTGLVFTFLFAVGVVLITQYASQIDLDQECVLYGELAYTPLEQLRIGNNYLGPIAIYTLGSTALAVLAFIWAFYKELNASSFDPDFSATIGIRTTVWHYALMGMVSLTTVIAFESVGAILIIALLVGPATTALLLYRNLPQVLAAAIIFSGIAVLLGYTLAYLGNASIAGAISIVIGVQYATVYGYTHFAKTSNALG